jgi:hypothetical protein
VLDAVLIEKAGIPGIAVVTDPFNSTAREMAGLWGVPGFRFVMMPHPLASLTAPEVDRRAQELVDKVLELLRAGQPSASD